MDSVALPVIICICLPEARMKVIASAKTKTKKRRKKEARMRQGVIIRLLFLTAEESNNSEDEMSVNTQISCLSILIISINSPFYLEERMNRTMN